MRNFVRSLTITFTLLLVLASRSFVDTQVSSQQETEQATLNRANTINQMGNSDEPVNVQAVQTAGTSNLASVSILSYQINVNCMVDEMMEITLTHTGVTADQVSYSFNASSWWNKSWPDQKDSILIEMHAFDLNENELDVTEHKDDTTSNYIFTVATNHLDSIVISYKVNVGFWDPGGDIFSEPTRMGGYVGDGYCVIDPALLFLTPLNIESTVSTVRVAFSIPAGWEVATFWDKVGEWYTGQPHVLRMTKGPFGFGRFAFRRQSFGDTDFVAAVADGVAQQDAVLSKAIDLYNYYGTEVFGESDHYTYNGAERDGYIAIFIPASDAFYNMYHEE